MIAALAKDGLSSFKAPLFVHAAALFPAGKMVLARLLVSLA
jgi:hypothetical protein